MANSPEALGEISAPTIQTPEEGVSQVPQAGSEPAELPFNVRYADALGPYWKSFRRGPPGKLVGPATLFSGLK